MSKCVAIAEFLCHPERYATHAHNFRVRKRRPGGGRRAATTFATQFVGISTLGVDDDDARDAHALANFSICVANDEGRPRAGRQQT